MLTARRLTPFQALRPLLMMRTPLPPASACAPNGRTIRRLQARDPVALAELYVHYGPLTYSLIVRIVRDCGIAEDLVQETFLCVWRSAHQLDSERATVVPWLRTVARNRALDYLRSPCARWQYGPQKLPLTDEVALAGQGAPPAHHSLTLFRLSAALQKLSVNHRAVIDMAYFDGYSHREIAVLLGHPLGTVKSRLRRALKALREAMEGRPAAAPVAGC